jgi:hypothetical protein
VTTAGVCFLARFDPRPGTWAFGHALDDSYQQAPTVGGDRNEVRHSDKVRHPSIAHLDL